MNPVRRTVVVFGLLASVLAGCPKDEPSNVGEVKKGPDAAAGTVIKVETSVPWGKKVSCEALLDPVKLAEALGEAEVIVTDATAGGEKEASAICSVKKGGKIMDAKEQAKLYEKNGFKIGVQPGDEICQLKAYCSYHYDPAQQRKDLETAGQSCATGEGLIGDMTCVQQVQAGADYRYIVTVLDPDTRCRYTVSPTTITEVEPIKACAKAFVEQIGLENLKVL